MYTHAGQPLPSLYALYYRTVQYIIIHVPTQSLSWHMYKHVCVFIDFSSAVHVDADHSDGRGGLGRPVHMLAHQQTFSNPTQIS